jgi:hypothetical protein
MRMGKRLLFDHHHDCPYLCYGLSPIRTLHRDLHIQIIVFEPSETSSRHWQCSLWRPGLCVALCPRTHVKWCEATSSYLNYCNVGLRHLITARPPINTATRRWKLSHSEPPNLVPFNLRQCWLSISLPSLLPFWRRSLQRWQCRMLHLLACCHQHLIADHLAVQNAV